MRKVISKGTLSAKRAYGDHGAGGKPRGGAMLEQGRTGALQAIYQDLGAGDGTWPTPNPRALQILPQLLMQLELIGPLVEVVTNMHFLTQKARERGITEVYADLEEAAVLVKSVASKGVSGKGGEDPPPDLMLGWESHVKEFLLFVKGNAEALAEDPRNLFALGKTWSTGGVIPDAVEQATTRAEAVVRDLHRVGEMVEIERKKAEGGQDVEEQENDAEDEELGPQHLVVIVRMLLHLRVVLDQGIYRAMDEQALQQILHAEEKGKEAVKVLVGMMEDEEENAVERIGRVVTAEVCGGATPHWEKEEVFSILAEIFLFDDTFVVPFEPDKACVSLSLSEEIGEEGGQSREEKLKEVLSEITKCEPSCFEIQCTGNQAVVSVVKPPSPPEVPPTDDSEKYSNEDDCEGPAQNDASFAHPSDINGENRGEDDVSNEQDNTDVKNGVDCTNSQDESTLGDPNAPKDSADGETNDIDEEASEFKPRNIANMIMYQCRDAESDLRKSGLVLQEGGGDGWREICVYVSSTVQDMKAERTVLSRFVLPALRAACRRRKIRLRWLHLGSMTPASLEDSLRWVSESGIQNSVNPAIPERFRWAVLGTYRANSATRKRAAVHCCLR